MKKEEYDVVVIGSGAAGGGVARRCNDAGLRVAVVERNGWGGVCPLRGCEPKKIFADTAHAVTRVRSMQKQGVVGDTRIDWDTLWNYKHTSTEPISDAVRDSLEKAGIAVIAGDARFDGNGDVEVPGYGVLQAQNVVIGVGASPKIPDIPGKELLLTSDDFLNLKTMPESLIFVGGGFISFEFASVAAAVGAKATILNRSERVLRGFDRGLTERLVKAMESHGVEVLLNHPVDEVKEFESGVSIVTSGENGNESFSASLAVVAAGRTPNIESLQLDNVGVEKSSGGIKVNGRLQSTNPRIYAAGDCVEPGLALTPVAALQADTIAANIIDDAGEESDLRGTGSTVFTDPPLMAVGLLEEEAREQGASFTVYSGDAAKWSEHKRIGMDYAEYKVLVEKESDIILGAHYLGQHAEEVANIFGLAIRYGLTRKDLLAHPWAYPSFGYALRYMIS